MNIKYEIHSFILNEPEMRFCVKPVKSLSYIPKKEDSHLKITIGLYSIKTYAPIDDNTLQSI